jgi:hypothetical protein
MAAGSANIAATNAAVTVTCDAALKANGQVARCTMLQTIPKAAGIKDGPLNFTW